MTKKVGVIGAGQMGHGVAHVSAAHGYEVALVDIDQTALDTALEQIRTGLDRQVAKHGDDPASVDAAMAKIPASRVDLNFMLSSSVDEFVLDLVVTCTP